MSNYRGLRRLRVNPMKKGGRIFGTVFGFFLLGIGVYALLAGTPVDWRSVGGIVLVVLGGNALYASCVGKPSWLSRIGPLP